MIENSTEFNMVEQNHFEDTVNEDPKTKANNDHIKILEGNYKAILEELIEDSILDVCFEFHRAEKIGFSFYESIEEELKTSEKNSKNGGKEQLITVHCIECSKKISAEKFCQHLEKCMGINKRKNCQRNASFKEDSDSETSDSDTRASSSKKKTKKRINNKNKQSKRQGNFLSRQSSDNIVNYDDMTKEEIVAFFNQHCGVLSKRSKMPCKMTPNCSRHKDNERTIIRNDIFSNMNDEIPSDEQQIDVDIIDENFGS